MQDWLYIAACVAVPAVWGVFSAWLFARIDSRRNTDDPDRPSVDYMI